MAHNWRFYSTDHQAGSARALEGKQFIDLSYLHIEVIKGVYFLGFCLSG